jgi:hypothetical protein
MNHTEMELATTAEIYQPTVDDDGNYVDIVPKFDSVRKECGIRCPCAQGLTHEYANRGKTFYERANLYAHTKSKYHQDWLAGLNREKTNHLSKLHVVSELVDQQKIIIAQQAQVISQRDQVISQKDQEIKKLLDMITMITNLKLQEPVYPPNLLDFDE